MLTRAATCHSVFEAELADHIPVVKTSIAGTRLVGRLTVGERRDVDATVACWHEFIILSVDDTGNAGKLF